jgi:DNA polymerase delta subunit 2
VPYVAKTVNLQLGKPCFVIGTVYVDAPLKPNILDEITREAWIQAPPVREKYTSEEDRILLEDESGRIVLAGNRLKEELLTTGMIVGIFGQENRDGSFTVIDIAYPAAMNPQRALSTEGSWIVLMSGLDVVHDLDFRLQMFADYITGEVGSQSVGSTKLDIRFHKSIVPNSHRRKSYRSAR